MDRAQMVPNDAILNANDWITVKSLTKNDVYKLTKKHVIFETPFHQPKRLFELRINPSKDVNGMDAPKKDT